MARTLVARSITWLLVSTSPEAEMIIPVPSAVSPLYLRFDMMSTRPGSTFFRTASGLSGAAEAPLPDALSCGPGTSLEETPAAGAALVAAERDGRPGADARRERGDGHVDQQPPAPRGTPPGGGSGAGQPGAPPPPPWSG